MKLGRMIKKRRLELGIQAVDVSSDLGYDTDSFIHQIEGGYKPPIKKVPTLANILRLRGQPRALFFKIYLKEFHEDAYNLALIAFKNNNNGVPKKREVKVKTKLKREVKVTRKPKERVVKLRRR